MDDLKLNKILSIIIIILSGIIIYFYISRNKLEHLNTSNEAIQNIGTNFSNINTTVSINRLGVKGAVNFTALKGIIVAWSGAISDIPDGWGFCDGSTYTAFDGTSLTTPDLRSKFILGSSTEYPLSEQGGEETHVLSEKEIPSHTHTTMSDTIFGCSNPFSQTPPYKYVGGYLGGNCDNSANYNQTTSSATGKNLPHNNMPPYYTLAFIMKL